MTHEAQAAAMIGAINLLGDVRDELLEKELPGAADEVGRAQASLRRQLGVLVEEAHLNRIEVLRPLLIR